MKMRILALALLEIAGVSCGGRDARDVNGTGGASANGDAPGDLDVGAYDLDLEVTYNGTSQHLTSCAEGWGRMTMVEDTDGTRFGMLTCLPDYAKGAPWALDSFGLSFDASALGQHDASALTTNCDASMNGCDGARLSIVFQIDNRGLTVDSVEASSKSGSITLDEFSADGHVKGSIDLTMAQGGYELSVKGQFAAHLKDCGAASTALVRGCLGPYD